MKEFNCKDMLYNRHNCGDDEKLLRMFGDSDFSLCKYKCKSIAVIGNSSKLLDKDYGEEIDAHDYVIRFNYARTKGYEIHVGSRTDIRFLGTIRYFREKDEIRIQRFNQPKYKNRAYMRHNNDEPLAGPMIDYKERWVDSMYAVTHRFHRHTGGSSMGFLGVMTALNLADKVSLYGFWNPKTDKNVKYHYFDDKLRDVKGVIGGHSFSKERARYVSFAKKNEGRLIIRD